MKIEIAFDTTTGQLTINHGQMPVLLTLGLLEMAKHALLSQAPVEESRIVPAPGILR